MKTIDLTPVEKREPLIINYGSLKIGPLPAQLPSELLTAIDSIPQPKVMAGKQKEDYEEQVERATAAFLYNFLIPQEQRSKLSLDDIGVILPAWMNYVNAGESSGSELS